MMARLRWPLGMAVMVVAVAALSLSARLYYPYNPEYSTTLGHEALIDLGLRADVPTIEGPSVDILDKFGHNPDIGTAAFEPVWSEGGPYPGWLDSAVTMSIASTDADDTALGTGARTVQIYGHDGDLLELAPISVSLDGQTPAVIPTDLRRIYRVTVETAGASNGNEGIIRVGVGAFTSGVPATVYARIDAPDSALDLDEVNQTLMALWTCPSDAICLITSLTIDSNADAQYRIKRRADGSLWQVKRIGDALAGFVPPYTNGTRQVLQGGEDVECQVKSASGGPIEAGCAFSVRIYRGL